MKPELPFHPSVSEWFARSFAAPTPCQVDAWAAIKRGAHTLIAAPTGSGKTLAAFLAAIDDLVTGALERAPGPTTRVVYVSPLKALSNDIHINLEAPLNGIRETLRGGGYPEVTITTAVRTGDTSPAARAVMRRMPPDILVTTPESLYVLLTSDSGRAMLAGARTVIVDEIHAVAGTKRGSHLALSLERLQALCERPLQRIGLSATQRPIGAIARFLIGNRDGGGDCTIIDTGHLRRWDLGVELPASPLEAVASLDQARETYDRVAALIGNHRTTLVFVNTRRMAERVARALSERLGEEHVTSHHGSLAKERRLDAEQRLKAGRLRALVATASLELGIDIGEVDLVCQLGVTRSLSTLLQRIGRSGHGIGRVPKGRLFPQTRDELVTCAALLDMSRRGELDSLRIPVAPLDVLAQQLVAEVACREWDESALFDLVRRAEPYRDLTLDAFTAVVRMLAEGYASATGRRGAHLHRDAVNRRLRGRLGARLTAVTCGGAIPDNADYDVILEPNGQVIGTVNEDFAIESLPGNIFQLGNASWRLLRVEQQALRVADAEGQPPNIPFWLGEAPARTDELSAAVSRLRQEFESRAAGAQSREAITDWLAQDIGVGEVAARQIYDYLEGARAVLGCLPTQDTLVMERFFDEAGGQQLVIHAPLGGRINRAWGLALRKRFCRKFNFELQAAASEDAIVLSLGPVHSFALAEVWRYLTSETVRDVLVQAVLTAPMFPVRWRWNATSALAVRRFRDGRKVPALLQRMQAEDLAAVVFPDQLACAENLSGRREVPDHPLVNQTIDDCLSDAMDIDGLKRLLEAIGAGAKRLVERDLTEPSPLAMEILNANPYAFLDDAPLEERRTRAVQSRRWLDPAAASGIGSLDPAAIERVRSEVWPAPRSSDELHEALLFAGFLAAGECRACTRWFEELRAGGRAALVSVSGAPCVLWGAAERIPELVAAFAPSMIEPPLSVPEDYRVRTWTSDTALVELLRSRLEMLGPVTAEALAAPLGLSAPRVLAALAALEHEGSALRGRFDPQANSEQWCDRRLLARIHRYTVDRLRREIEPVSTAQFLRFLTEWQYLDPGSRRAQLQGVADVVQLLSGFEAAAGAWEAELLARRVNEYESAWLDQHGVAGTVSWARLSLSASPRALLLRSTPVALMPRAELKLWLRVARQGKPVPELSGRAERVRAFIERHGASFFDDLAAGVGLIASEVEAALAELIAAGCVHADGFSALRSLILPTERRAPRRAGLSRQQRAGGGVAGRWARLPLDVSEPPSDEDHTRIAHILLRRYGVVFRRVLDREEGLPAWRNILWALRRLEMAGEVRGGRFVDGHAGEQFALPDAVGLLREVRHRAVGDEILTVSAADPLNLSGILTPGVRIPSIGQHRLALLEGVPVAVQTGAEIRLLENLEADVACRVRTALIDRRAQRYTYRGMRNG